MWFAICVNSHTLLADSWNIGQVSGFRGLSILQDIVMYASCHLCACVGCASAAEALLSAIHTYVCSSVYLLMDSLPCLLAANSCPGHLRFMAVRATATAQASASHERYFPGAP